MKKLTRQNPDLGIVLLPGFKDERGISVHENLKKLRHSSDQFLVNINEKRFGDGEGTIVFAPKEPTTRGKHLVFIADTTNYDSTYQMHGFTNRKSPDDHFADLKSGINAATGKAKTCSVIMPYFYRSREDKRGYRGSLDCARALQELEKMGVKHIITVDVHNPAIQNAIPNIIFDNILPSYPMLKAILEDEYAAYQRNQIMTISPDEGAGKRTSAYSSMLSAPMGFFYKERDFKRYDKKGKHPIKTHIYTGGSVEGKTAIIFDDILASGETLLDTAKRLKTPINKGGFGAKKVIAAVTHGLFNNGFEAFDKAAEDEVLTRVYTTNSAYIPAEAKIRPWLKVVDITQEIAETIDALGSNKSMTPYVRGSQKIQGLLKGIGK